VALWLKWDCLLSVIILDNSVITGIINYSNDDAAAATAVAVTAAATACYN